MKTNDVISAAELSSIITTYGPGHVSVDGEMPYEYFSVDDLELDAKDQFEVSINYSNQVQFHLVSNDMRAIVTTGLRGRVEKMEWVA
jgi:hypothetical protein